jgi:hypothetical protein
MSPEIAGLYASAIVDAANKIAATVPIGWTTLEVPVADVATNLNQHLAQVLSALDNDFGPISMSLPAGWKLGNSEGGASALTILRKPVQIQ